MKYIFISDIHANLEAFHEAQKEIEKEKPDKVLCVGDIVGYGPSPGECIDITRQLSKVCVAGNHDYACCDKLDLGYFYEEGRTVLEWTKEVLSDSQKSYLDSLQLMYEEDNFFVVHGTLDYPEKFDYLISEMSARNTFSKMGDKEVTFLGHTHIPFVLMLDKEKGAMYIHPIKEDVGLSNRYQYIINVGSVGQPRDRNTNGCLCIYDSDSRVVRFRRFQYNIKTTQKKIKDNKLPLIFAQRLEWGW